MGMRLKTLHSVDVSHAVFGCAQTSSVVHFEASSRLRLDALRFATSANWRGLLQSVFVTCSSRFFNSHKSISVGYRSSKFAGSSHCPGLILHLSAVYTASSSGGLWQYQCFKQFLERLQIPETDAAGKLEISDLAMQASKVANERYAMHETIRKRIMTDLSDGRSLSDRQRLFSWWNLDFSEFRREVRKLSKRDIPDY